MTQQINLYQEQFRERRDLADTAHLALGLALVLAVLSVIGVGLGWRADRAEERAAALAQQRDTVQASLASLQERLQARQGDDDDDDAGLARLRREFEARRRLVGYLDARAARTERSFSAYLEGLARSTVDALWLERVELAAGGQRLRLAGHALRPEQVPTLLDRLSARTAFRGHSFRTLRMDRDGEDEGRLAFVLASDRREGGE